MQYIALRRKWGLSLLLLINKNNHTVQHYTNSVANLLWGKPANIFPLQLSNAWKHGNCQIVVDRWVCWANNALHETHTTRGVEEGARANGKSATFGLLMLANCDHRSWELGVSLLISQHNYLLWCYLVLVFTCQSHACILEHHINSKFVCSSFTIILDFVLCIVFFILACITWKIRLMTH